MSWVLIFMSAFAITGFATEHDCMAARDAVVRQFGRNLDAGCICLQVPEGGKIIAGGGRR